MEAQDIAYIQAIMHDLPFLVISSLKYYLLYKALQTLFRIDACSCFTSCTVLWMLILVNLSEQL